MNRRRVLAAVVGSVCAALTMSGCKFNGAYDLPLPGSPVDKNHSFLVTAEFKDILNVVPHSPVMVDDVTVGEVVDVARIGWDARVTLRVKSGVVLPDNAAADIRQVSLLGEKYVSLEASPTKKPVGRLSNGDDIPLSDTGRNPEVEEVLGALSFLLSGGGVGQIRIISDELNKVMSGRQDRLRHLLGNLDSLVGTLDVQKQDIVRALDSINSLTKTLNREHSTVTAALDTMGPAVNVLRAEHGQLITMLRQLDKLGVVGTRVIGHTKDNVLADLAHLRPILRKLNQAGQSLPKGLSLMISFPFPKEASQVVKGDFANTSIAMDVSLGNLFRFYGVPTGPLQVPGILGLKVPKLPKLKLPSCTPGSPRCQRSRRRPEVPAAARRPCRVWAGSPVRRTRDPGTSPPAAASSGVVSDDEAWGQGPADRVPGAERGRNRLHHRQLPRLHRQDARPPARHTRHPAEVLRTLRRQ